MPRGGRGKGGEGETKCADYLSAAARALGSMSICRVTRMCHMGLNNTPTPPSPPYTHHYTHLGLLPSGRIGVRVGGGGGGLALALFLLAAALLLLLGTRRR